MNSQTYRTLPMRNLDADGPIMTDFYRLDVNEVVNGCKRIWRDGRVVEGERLEIVCTGNRTGGSNPSPSEISSF